MLKVDWTVQGLVIQTADQSERVKDCTMGMRMDMTMVVRMVSLTESVSKMENY